MSYSLDMIAHLYHSQEFEVLHQKFNRFNPLKVLQVDQYEIRHSNVLAWLLDPNENHHLGDFFVKKILSRLITKPENEDKLKNIDLLLRMYRSFGDTQVEREVRTTNNRLIDILLTIPSQNLVVVIENKFYSGEGREQLRDYLEYVQETYVGFEVVPIYLTLNNDTPSHSKYLTLHYKDVLEIITHHSELQKDAMSENVYQFLGYYTDILKEELVEDEHDSTLALEVYQLHKNAIELLFLSQHPNVNGKSRYTEITQYLKNLSKAETDLLKEHYNRNHEAIDFIFKIGSNVIRQAFLDFVKIEDIPEEVYKDHSSLPNFLLPDWIDYERVLGKPEQGYWLGQGFIIWFERTGDDRLKINVEVGPIPFENRFRLLSELETLGVSFQSSGKLEGKKYTKIYTHAIDIKDWANKTTVVEGMEELYHHEGLNNTFKSIAIAVEKMEKEESGEVRAASEPKPLKKSAFPSVPFERFASHYDLDPSLYHIKNSNISFLVPIFRQLEDVYGQSREKWWWHDSTFTYWFERLKDDRLKLTLELGPIQPDQRITIIANLERKGHTFSQKSKLPPAKFTRLYTGTKVINDWDDIGEVSEAMVILFQESGNQKMLEDIKSLYTE